MRTASIRGFGGSTPNRVGLPVLQTTPELPLRGNNEVLVKRIGMGSVLEPFASITSDVQIWLKRALWDVDCIPRATFHRTRAGCKCIIFSGHGVFNEMMKPHLFAEVR